MSRTPFMPLWVADFLAKTIDLDAKEIGAYMLILMSLWTHEGRLPNDPKKLQRIARCGRDWPTIWAAIEKFFDAEDGQISNRRLTEELQKVATKRAVSSHAGSLGGKAKALKNKGRPLADATVSLKQPYSEPELDKRESANALSNAPARFEDFWQAYPHRGGAKKGRKLAEAAYVRAVRSGTIEADIIAGAGRYKSDRQVLSGFAKDPATWLNQKCWADDIEPATNIIPIDGGQNANAIPRGRVAFDVAHREYTRRLAAGQIDRGPDPSDPFAWG